MKVWDNIRNWWLRRDRTTVGNGRWVYGGLDPVERLPFADVIFYNICDILTDICSSVSWQYKGGQAELFASFKVFFDAWGKFVLNLLFKDGYAVIGRRKDSNYFWVLKRSEYNVNTGSDGRIYVFPYDRSVDVYVMNSQTMLLENASDKTMLRPFLDLLDSVLNGANTVSKRLGAMVIMSPAQTSTPNSTIMTRSDRERLEKELGENYGYLRNQKSVLLLSNAMSVQTISLAGLDNRMSEKVKTSILAICDRIKVPANQVAIIDANSSKSLANGSELREGDIQKYRNFRRLLNYTWWQFAEDLGLRVDYTIENEPRERVGV